MLPNYEHLYTVVFIEEVWGGGHLSEPSTAKFTLKRNVSNLNFHFSLGLIVELSSGYGMRFLHFLTKTGPHISKKLQYERAL